MRKQEWIDLQRESVEKVLDALRGPSIVAHAEQSKGVGPWVATRALYAASVEPYEARWTAYKEVKRAYEHGAVSQHRAASGAVFRHRFSTGLAAHAFLAPGKPADDVPGQASYLLSPKEIEDVATMGGEAYLMSLYRNGLEGSCVIPLGGSAHAYGTDFWGERLLQGPRDLALPLYANVVEAALAHEAGYAPPPAEFLEMAKSRSWFDCLDLCLDWHAQLAPLKLMDLPRGPLKVDKLLALCDLDPRRTFYVSALGHRNLWDHVKERLTWIVLLGDKLVLYAALEALVRHAKKEISPSQLGLVYFALHQIHTAPIFSARGGVVNASDGDVKSWMDVVDARAYANLGAQFLDEVIFGAWKRLDPVRTSRARKGDVGDVGDFVPVLAAKSISPGELPERLEAARGLGLRGLLGSPDERVETLARSHADIQAFLLTPVRDAMLARAGQSVVRHVKTAVTTMALGPIQVLDLDPGLKAFLKMREIEAKARDVQASVDGCMDLIREVGRSTVYAWSDRPTFAVWAEEEERPSLRAAFASDGPVMG